MSTTTKPLGRALRLEVEADPLPGQLVNLVPNTDGALGGWGWLTPASTNGATVEGVRPAPSNIRTLQFTAGTSGAQWFTSEPLPITGNWYVAASWNVPIAGVYMRARFEFLDAAQNVLSSSPQSNYIGGAGVVGPFTHGPYQMPATAVYVRLRFDVYGTNAGANPAAGAHVYVTQVTVAQAATSGALGTNITNLLANPSFEADLSSWSTTGTATATRDTAEHQDGAASVRINNTNTTTAYNRVPNPSFEVDLQGWASGSGSSAVLARQAGVGTSGGVSLRVNGPGGTSFQQHEIKVHGTNNIAASYPDILRLRANVRVDGGWPANSYVAIGVRYFDGAGNEINAGVYTFIASITNPAPDVWHTLDSSQFIPHAGTAYVRPFLFIHKGGGGSSVIDSTDNVWLDAVMLELTGYGKTGGGAYFDGSTGNDALTTHGWTGTPHYSMSTEVVRVAPSGVPGIASAVATAYPAAYHTVSAYVKGAAGAQAASVVFTLDWYAGGTLVRHDTTNVGTTTGAWQRIIQTVSAPANADGVVVGVGFGYSSPTSVYYIDAVMLELGQVAHPFIIGATSTPLSFIPPLPYVNILGTAHDLTITRQGLNVGTLTAHIVDSSLDPTQSGIIRPGRAVRLTAYDASLNAWREVFTGKAAHATVAYKLTRPDDNKRAEIELTAVDNVQTLANQSRVEGVSHIYELPYVLEGAGVPWNVNGSGNQVPNAVVAATSDGASALDQVGLTRDTELGLAWVNRMGVLFAVDAAHRNDAPVLSLDEGDYIDVDIAYDSQVLMNEVTVHNTTYDAAAEENTTTDYGPYRDEESIRTWGVWSADFTAQGIPQDEPTVAAYAQRILDANGTPLVRLNSMALHVDLSADWSGVVSPWAFLELYDVVGVTCARAGMTDDPMRVVEITHTINGADSTWHLDLAFNDTGRAALPTSSVGGGVTTGGGSGTGGGGSGGGAPTGPAGGDLAGAYPNPEIGPGKVGTPELADAAVTSAKIQDGTIVAADLAPGVIPAPPSSLPPSGPAGGDLTGNYPNPQIANGAVSTTKLAAGAVGNVALGANAVTTDKIAAGAVEDTDLATGAVTALKIAAGAVGNTALAGNAVTTDKIANGTILPADLDAALASSIANAAVDSLVVHKAGAETVTGVKTFDAPQVQTYQGVTPPTPPAGHATGIYFGADGLPYYETPAGVVVPVSVGNTTQSALHTNPSFESWSSGPDGWDTFWQQNGTVAQETVDVLNGTKALTSNLAAVAGANHLIMSSVFTVAPGDLVNVGVWARAVAGAPNVSVGIMSAPSGTPAPFDGVSTQQVFDWAGISASWTKYEKQFTIPAGHAVCRLIFRTGKVAGDATVATTRIDYTLSARTGQSSSTLPGNSWPKESVRVVDTSTSIPTSTAPSTVDGVNLAVGDRVLKAVPGGHINNGVYTVVTVGTGANGVWQRASDATTPAQLAGAQVAVAQGTLYGGQRWASSCKATDIVGTTVLSWAPIPRDVVAWRRLRRNGDFGTATGAQALPFNVDNGGANLNTDGTNLVVVVPGVYSVTTNVTFLQTGGAGSIWHIASLRHNRGTSIGTLDVVGSTAASGLFVDVAVTATYDAIAGDTFQVVVTSQYSALANCQSDRCFLTAHRIAGLP